MENSKNKSATKPNPISIVSAVFPGGQIVETVLDPETRKTSFAISKNGETKIVREYLDSNGRTHVPPHITDALLKNKVVCFPSEPTKYVSTEHLLDDIQDFIHRYVDLTDEFEKVASYYALLTWVYDQFNELPYLRKIGDFGSGKTRFLKVLGSICYKTVFASGGTSTAALFHIIDKFKGTLVLDEADFHFSDEKAAVSKILNNGNASGFPVLRVSQDKNSKFSPVSYDVYCPKIIASRNNYDDQALESRFITETFKPQAIRNEIPTTLPESFEKESLKLRNKLLSYRFDTLFRTKAFIIPESVKLEGRISQIFSPLLSVVANQEDKALLLSMAKQYSDNLIDERGQSIEAQVLTVIKELQEENRPLSIKEITNKFYIQFSGYYDRRVTAKWIGFVVRKKLNLSTYKSNGNYILEGSFLSQNLKDLYSRYGVE